MNKVKFLPKIALAVGISLAMIFTISCSDGGGDEPSNANSVKKEKITGLSQKGPFAQGSAVKLYELNENLQKTSTVFQGATTDNNGNFEININKELVSPYVILEVSGKYANEVSGQQSSEAITLIVITDIKNRNSVNINVLTHLEYNRVQSLLANSSGISFEAAKQQAQEEVLTALGMETSESINSEDLSIFGSRATDSLLLLASIFVQGERSTEEVSNLLTGISNEIKATGTLSDKVKSEVANSLANVDWNEVVSNIQNLDQNARVPDIKDVEDIIKEIDQEAKPPENTSYTCDDGRTVTSQADCNSGRDNTGNDNNNNNNNNNNGSGTCTGGEAAGCSNNGNNGTGTGGNDNNNNNNNGSGTCTGGEAAGCSNTGNGTGSGTGNDNNNGSGTCTGGEAAGCSNTGTGTGSGTGNDNNNGSGTCTGGEAAGCSNTGNGTGTGNDNNNCSATGTSGC